MSDGLFSLTDIIGKARTITDQPGFLELRSDYAQRHNLDKASEDLLLALRYMMRNEPLRVVSVRSVYDAVVSKIGRQIRIKGVQTDSESRCVYGYVEDDGTFPLIVYNKTLNLCWQRFTIVKELMHLYLGIRPNHLAFSQPTSSVAEQIVNSAVESRRVFPQKTDGLDEESAALFMAIEVLLPWRLRMQFLTLASYRATAYQIAKVFLIPLNFVQFVLTTPADCKECYLAHSTRLDMSRS